MSGEIIRTKNLAVDAANFILEIARKSLAERREFRVALSGGNTPRPVYTELRGMAAIFHGIKFWSLSATNGACPRMMRRAISGWRGKHFFFLRAFRKSRLCGCEARSILE